MSSNSDNAPQISLLKAPLTAKLFAFLLCPALLIFTCYQGKVVVGLVEAGNQGAEFSTASLIFVLALIALILFSIATAWQLATYYTTAQARIREGGLSRRARYQEDMLRLVSDNIPNTLFISDTEGRMWFANREAAEVLRSPSTEIVGKNIDRLFPPRAAQLLVDRVRRAQKAGAPVITIDRNDDATGPHYTQTYHIPLPNTEELQNVVLIMQKDVTDVIVERERQEQIFKQLVDTLIAVVDRRDPYAAGHSLRVGSVSHSIATEMNLDSSEVEACQIAGSLMNLGKVLVPRSILVKTSTLNPDELRLVRKSILTSADILSLISFQAPVIPTLRQVLERFDGQGEPERRKGENILLTARIVAVANAFVALVSPRAHRAGLSIEAALASLRADAGNIYDPRIVEALAVYLMKNPDARESLVKPPAELRGALTERDFLSD